MNFNADISLKDPSEDQFQRFPFAEAIANSIIRRDDPNPLVIGINGSWGEGKTTVLDFIDGIIAKVPGHTVVRFNPWRYATEDILLDQFFQTLAKAIRSKEPQTWRTRIKSKNLKSPLENIFSLFAPAAGTAENAAPGLGNLAADISKRLSSVELIELKERFNTLLKNSKQKLVIIVDDIDRLEDTEVHALFRLVKLTADFHNTTYILSFDEKVIAKVVEQKHTSTNSGGSFLEKIIQVPLRLPPAQSSDLQRFCLDGIAKVLSSKGVKITSEEERVFTERLLIGILPMIKTPRMAIRYWNSVNYAMDMLYGEVNIADLVTLEGLKIFKNGVYEFIRRNKTLLTTSFRPGARNLKREDALALLDPCFSHYKGSEENSLKPLLLDLFPYLRELYENVDYPKSFSDDLIVKKSISSPLYFDRYFALVVPKNQISDLGIEKLLKIDFKQGINFETVLGPWNTLISTNASELFTKLITQQSAFSYTQFKLLLKLIAKSSSALSLQGAIGFIGSDVSIATIMIVQLLRRFRLENDIWEILVDFVENNDSSSFTLHLIHFLYPDKKIQNPFPDNDQVRILLKQWISRNLRLSGSKPLFDRSNENGLSVLLEWHSIAENGEVDTYINQHLTHEPSSVIDLLLTFTPLYTNTSTGQAGYGNFTAEHYDKLKKIVDTNFLFNFINDYFDEQIKSDAKFSDTLINPQQSDHNVLRQFIKQHQQATSGT